MTSVRALILEPQTLSQKIKSAANIVVEAGIQLIASVSQPDEALSLIEQEQPDVFIIDLPQSLADGLPILAALRARKPRTFILARTDCNDDGFMLEAVESGVTGFISPAADQAEILAAIQSVREGKPFLPPQMTISLLDDIRQAYASVKQRPRKPTGHQSSGKKKYAKPALGVLAVDSLTKETADTP